MHTLLRALAIGCVCLCACPGEEETPTCGNLDTTLLPRAQPASFSSDIVPIFRLSCIFSACHGSSTAANGLYLNDPDLTRLHGTIVGVPSQHLPAMPFVTAGDPQASFLMRKLDNTHCQLHPQCVKADCGVSMPFNSEPLAADARNTVRAWIAEGAKNN